MERNHWTVIHMTWAHPPPPHIVHLAINQISTCIVFELGQQINQITWKHHTAAPTPILTKSNQLYNVTPDTASVQAFSQLAIESTAKPRL
jgi:hypothetical protein